MSHAMSNTDLMHVYIEKQLKAVEFTILYRFDRTLLACPNTHT